MSGELMTPRLCMPLLAAGQAQKEVTHNEALALIDMAVAPLVEEVGLNAPPTVPLAGQQWIVGAAPEGAWIGQAAALAGWTAAGWRFVQLPPGASVTESAGLKRWRRGSSGWLAPAAVESASGGATIDGECRAQLAAVINALAAQGLLTTEI